LFSISLLTKSNNLKLICLSGCTVYYVDMITRILYIHRDKIKHLLPYVTLSVEDNLYKYNGKKFKVSILDYYNIKLDFDYN